jgi:glycerol-1-phosphatase
MTGPLHARYDVALLDLDGVVYIGPDAVPHAVVSLSAARDAGMSLAYVTNNASRTPAMIAEHLNSFGLHVAADDVVTSAQAGARLVAEHLLPGAVVFVIGGEGVEVAVRERGFIPVRRGHGQRVEAVLQGFGALTSWEDLAEAAHHLRSGCLWVATNMDRSVPTARGPAPGNGAFVAVLEQVSGRTPLVAGKPQTPLMWESVQRTSALRPLVVGDRLDTDIEGAVRCGIDSLLVLTGVTSVRDLLLAPPHQRPTHIAQDLRALIKEPGDDDLESLRRACDLAWQRLDSGGEVDPDALVRQLTI